MDPFECFCRQRAADLKRIARATRGEHLYGDVVNQAWLMAVTLSSRHSRPMDFHDAQFQDLLLRHLYQALVRYTELNVRHAIRLDHGTGEDADGGRAHPLMNLLSSDGGRDPLAYLDDNEETPNARIEEPSPCLAGAWLVLLRSHGQRMRLVADHLLISVSYAYRRCAKASCISGRQNAIRFGPANHAQLGPWRRYRTLRTPRQLEFDFEERLAL